MNCFFNFISLNPAFCLGLFYVNKCALEGLVGQTQVSCFPLFPIFVVSWVYQLLVVVSYLLRVVLFFVGEFFFKTIFWYFAFQTDPSSCFGCDYAMLACLLAHALVLKTSSFNLRNILTGWQAFHFLRGLTLIAITESHSPTKLTDLMADTDVSKCTHPSPWHSPAPWRSPPCFQVDRAAPQPSASPPPQTANWHNNRITLNQHIQL